MTTNTERVAQWHAKKPGWASHFTGRDWDTAEQIAEQLDMAAAPENVDCDLAPAGHYCALEKGHTGDCRIYETP